MNFDAIKNALLTIGVPVSRYAAVEQKNKYIVWAEDNQAESVWADGEMQSQAIEGTVDYFTKQENDPNVDAIQNALNGVCSWRLNSIQYETDTKYLHYEFVWRLWR